MIFEIALACSLSGSPVSGSPVVWSFASSANKDGRMAVTLTARIEDGWHLYATSLPSDDGPLPTEVRFSPSSDFVLEGDLVGPEPIEEYDPNYMMVLRHHSGSPQFIQVIQPITKDTFTVEGAVEYMVCNDHTCLPPVVMPFSINMEQYDLKP